MVAISTTRRIVTAVLVGFFIAMAGSGQNATKFDLTQFPTQGVLEQGKAVPMAEFLDSDCLPTTCVHLYRADLNGGDGVIRLDMRVNFNSVIELQDIHGKRLEVGETEIKIHGLQPGPYIIRVSTKSRTYGQYVLTTLPGPSASPISAPLLTVKTDSPKVEVYSTTQPVKVGQSREQVHTAIGPPIRSRKSYLGEFEEWNVPSNGRPVILVVQYSQEGTVVRFDNVIEVANNDPALLREQRKQEKGSWTDVADKVITAVDGVMLTHYCPRVYRIPVIYMTASDSQFLQACNANGYMLFGLYIYTGGQR